MAFKDNIKDLTLDGGKVVDIVKSWIESIKQWIITTLSNIKDFFINMPLWLQILILLIISTILAVGIWYVWRNRDQIPNFYD